MVSSAQPVTSISSTLWATASKEWVIPAKPKPGRKPKPETALPLKEDEEVDSQGRRMQNRAAQRAFRERKQSQLAELKARIKLYEQGEIERNVALQNIAKRLKEENENLRKENRLLQERVSFYEKEHSMNERVDAERKRWRDDSSSISSVSSNYSSKRIKLSAPTTLFTVPYTSPSPMGSSPESNDGSTNDFPTMHLDSPSRDDRFFHSEPSSFDGLVNLQGPVTAQISSGNSFSPISCGLCNQDTDCLCREIALHEAAASTTTIPDEIPATFEHERPTQILMPATDQPAEISILNKLPPYQPAVPLRRRTVTSNFNSVFPVSPPLQSSSFKPSATCSGDPTNCLACADDSFGKAFCAAIGESAATIPICDDCPCRSDVPSGSRGCCEDPTKCDMCQHPSPPSTSPGSTIPTNEAWQKLKSHPNVAFADLSLLADVVARRSKCTGPHVIISPALGAATPERVTSPSTASQSTLDEQAVLLADPHARYHERQERRPGSPLRLVPQEVLIECGRRRIREVRADAVKEALLLLDAKFSQS